MALAAVDPEHGPGGCGRVQSVRLRAGHTTRSGRNRIYTSQLASENNERELDGAGQDRHCR